MGRALASDGTSTAYPPLKYWKTADDAYRISIAVVGLLAGDISVDGLSVRLLKRKALFDLRRRMGMLFQSGALFTELSVFENVAFPLRVHTDLDDELIRLVVSMKLEAVGLRGALDLIPSELSGGMQRRVALARAIALDPEMIMYDEPFVGQDPIGLGVLLSLVKRLNQALGLTSVVVSHDLQETLSIADHVIMIANTRVAFEGSPQDMQYPIRGEGN